MGEEKREHRVMHGLASSLCCSSARGWLFLMCSALVRLFLTLSPALCWLSLLLSPALLAVPAVCLQPC